MSLLPYRQWRNGKPVLRFDWKKGYWRSGSYYRLNSCINCKAEFIDGNSRLRCDGCRDNAYGDVEYEQQKRRAHQAVALAISKGELRPPAEFECTDCDNRAQVYDHRSYDKRLDVQPVCRGCNVRRGSVADIGILKVRSRKQLTPCHPSEREVRR